MKTITIAAFGYSHEFTDNYNADDIDIIENAPVLYLLSGSEAFIDAIERELPMDSVLLWSDAGEALVFGYEDLSEEAEHLLGVLGLAWEYEDRSEGFLAA